MQSQSELTEIQFQFKVVQAELIYDQGSETEIRSRAAGTCDLAYPAHELHRTGLEATLQKSNPRRGFSKIAERGKNVMFFLWRLIDT